MERALRAVRIVFVVAAAAWALVWFFGPSDGADRVVTAATEVVAADGFVEAYARDEVPEGWRQLLDRDDIRPIYAPEFVAASESGWSGSDLVIGVEANGDARAYPVALLNRREMVNDVIGGEPLLVSW